MRKTSFSTIVLLLLAAGRGRPEPGTLIGLLPSSADGPIDMTHDDDRDTFWVTSAKVTRMLEMDLDGRWTGYEVPLPSAFGIGSEEIEAIALVGRNVLALGGGQILRIKAFEDDPAAPVPFVRGDANHDRKLDLSDAVSVLNFLFLGAAAPACLDAADSNDDGRADLSDAVYVLNHLFLGAAAPPAPYPGEGIDPTEDSLPCRKIP